MFQLFLDLLHFLTAKTRTVSERKENGRCASTCERDVERDSSAHLSYFRSPYWDTRYSKSDFKPEAHYEIDKLTCV